MVKEAQRSAHGFMKAHPDRVVSVDAESGKIEFSTRKSELDRYQLQARARHQIVLEDAQIRTIDRMVKGEVSLEQGIANIARTKQLTKTEEQRTIDFINRNRLWKAMDDIVTGSKNPIETLATFMKIIFQSAFR